MPVENNAISKLRQRRVIFGRRSSGREEREGWFYFICMYSNTTEDFLYSYHNCCQNVQVNNLLQSLEANIAITKDSLFKNDNQYVKINYLNIVIK